MKGLAITLLDFRRGAQGVCAPDVILDGQSSQGGRCSMMGMHSLSLSPSGS